MEQRSYNTERYVSLSDNIVISIFIALIAFISLITISSFVFNHFFLNDQFAFKEVFIQHFIALKNFIFNNKETYIAYSSITTTGIAVAVFLGVLIYREIFIENALMLNKHVRGNRYFKDEKNALEQANKELDEMRWSGDSFEIGGVKWTNDRTSKHIVVMGQTGGGKTTVIKPILRHAIEANDLLIVYDNKTEFTEILTAFDDEKDEKTVILGPWDSRSAYWDIAKDLISEQDARQFANTIIPTKGDDSVFSLGGKAIIAGALIALMNTQGRNWLASDLYTLINRNVKEFSELVKPHFSEIESLLSFDEEGEPVTATLNMMQNAVAYINPLLAILMASEGNKLFSISEFLKQLNSDKSEKQIIILQGNKKYASLQSTLYTLFLDTASAIINSPSFPERPADARGVWFMLDEFVQLNKLNNIKAIAEIGRSKGARLVLGFQDYSQLVETYGRESAEVLYGINQTHVFTKLSPKSADFVSREAGRKVIAKATQSVRSSQNGGEFTVYQSQEREESVINAHDFGVLKADKNGVEVIVTFGSNFYKLKQNHLKFEKIRERYVPQAWTGDTIDTIEELDPTKSTFDNVEEVPPSQVFNKIMGILKRKKQVEKKSIFKRLREEKRKRIIMLINNNASLIKSL